MNIELSIYERNVLLDAINDCYEKVTFSRTKIETSRKYRNTLRRLRSLFEGTLKSGGK